MCWPDGIGMVVLAGFIVMLLGATGLRERVMNAVPYGLRKAISIGIGLFIMLIGLVDSGDEGTQARRGGGPQAKGHIHMYPGAGSACSGANRFERIECARGDIARLGNHQRALVERGQLIGNHASLLVHRDGLHAVLAQPQHRQRLEHRAVRLRA